MRRRPQSCSDVLALLELTLTIELRNSLTNEQRPLLYSVDVVQLTITEDGSITMRCEDLYWIYEK